MEDKDSIFGPEFDEMALPSRKSLLPWWVKLFTWIFLISGVGAVILFLISFGGISVNLSLYGLSAGTRPLTVIGLILIILYSLKGATSICLLTEQDWAIKLGMVDAVAGISCCIFAMSYPLITGGSGFTFRGELILLIPYLRWLIRVRPLWEKR
ncbi:MAG TPA: hypothetical protein VGD35_06255 [Chitinophaga sp.]